MAYKTTREQMFTAGNKVSTKDMEEAFASIAKNAKKPRAIYAKVVDSITPYSNCYLCGTVASTQEIIYGMAGYNPNSIHLCPKCRKWFGEYLLSGRDNAQKCIE